MTREEALSLFLNIPEEDIYIQVDGSYIDNDRGLKYIAYTESEVLENVKEIVLNNLYKYDKNYLLNFISIKSENFINSAYSNKVAMDGLVQIMDNNSLSNDHKNVLILQLLDNFEDFFEYDIKKNNGFGGYLGSIQNKEYPIEGYLIYIFNV